MGEAQTPAAIGRFSIVRRIGAGGMAEVFLAKSTGAEGIEKVLVLKRVLPTFARSSKFIAMFLEEAKIATRLNHPNIVQVYVFEQVKDQFLLAMEFVDGLDLGRLISAAQRQERRLPPGISAFVIAEVAKGLDYAHKRRDESGDPLEIVHRDVSPQNVLLSYDGVVKVADFGIAKARMVSEDTGVIKGKFSYMSPEQARGDKVDRRSDVYSLGVLLAELLMGRVMYPGQHGLDVLEKVRQGEVTLPQTVNLAAPEELCQIVGRALSFERDERFATAREMATALAKYLHTQDEVQDGAVLERFILDTVPREATSPDGQVQQAAATLSANANAVRELRERRHVVVIAGRVRREGTDAGSLKEVEVDAEAARVLDQIAFKNDAVLSWPEGERRSVFRLTLGLRRASVHDPLQAMQLSLDVVEALQGLSADLLTPLTASLGVSRGVVSTVRDGQGRLLRYEPVGRLLDVAHRLADEGALGETLVAGEVFRLVRRVYAFEEASERSVDVETDATGGHRQLRAYSLRGALTREERAAEARGHSEGGLVGREEELRAIRTAYQEAVTTRRSVFLAVKGELGVGKTALTAAALEGFEGDPEILHTECAFGTTDVPYAAITDLIFDALQVEDGASKGEIGKKLVQATVDLFDDAQERRLVQEALQPLIVTGQKGKATEAKEDRSAMVRQAAGRLIAALARHRPLVIWVDAFQWADNPSMELIRSLTRDIHEVPLLAIFSTRPDPRAEQAIASVPHIDLAELSDEERKSLVRDRFEGATVPHEVMTAITDRAGGNPFFLVELVEALVDRGAVRVEGNAGQRRVARRPGVPIALPTTLEGVIAARLDELPDIERRAVRWVAVAGGGYDEQLLSDVAGEPLADALRSALLRGLLSRQSHQPSRGQPSSGFWFPSAVIRHVAYETTDAAERVRMHRRIGAWLSRRSEPTPPARIARHLEQAGEEAGAAAAYLQAAAGAHAVYSNREALRFYGRALHLLPIDSADRFRAHQAREEILRRLGRSGEQLVELTAMRTAADRSQNPGQLGIAYARLARYELESLQTAGVEPFLSRALSASIEAKDRGTEVEALRLQAELAQELGRTEDALKANARALGRCGTAPELLSVRGWVLVQRSQLLRRAGKLEQALEPIVEALVTFRRLGLLQSQSEALNALGVALASTGEWEDAIAAIRSSIVIDRQTGQRIRLGRKLSNVGQLLSELGDTAAALQFFDRAEESFDRVPDDLGFADALTGHAETLIEAGDIETATTKLDRALQVATRTGDRYDLARERIVRGALELKRGELSRAEKHAAAGLELSNAAGLVVYAHLAKAILAEALAFQGHTDQATTLATELESVALQEVDRAERVYLSLARTFQALGDRAAVERAYQKANAIVDRRLSHIRHESYRQRYCESPTVATIRNPSHFR
ncbi:MAG: protein kinase [Myxococcota bacterium]